MRLVVCYVINCAMPRNILPFISFHLAIHRNKWKVPASRKKIMQAFHPHMETFRYNQEIELDHIWFERLHKETGLIKGQTLLQECEVST